MQTATEKEWDERKTRLPSWKCSVKTQVKFEALAHDLNISKSCAIEEAMKHFIKLKQTAKKL